MSDRFNRGPRSYGGRGIVYVDRLPTESHPKRLFVLIGDPTGAIWERAGLVTAINPAYIDAPFEVVFVCFPEERTKYLSRAIPGWYMRTPEGRPVSTLSDLYGPVTSVEHPCHEPDLP